MLDLKMAEDIIEAARGFLESIPADTASRKPDVHIWSVKEIVGHLLDSACNNHQRFIRLQEGHLPDFPGYNQTFWVNAQQFNELSWQDLRQFWYSYNQHLLHVLKNINTCALENTWTYQGNVYTLSWLISDYYRHLKHHLEQCKKRLKPTV